VHGKEEQWLRVYLGELDLLLELVEAVVEAVEAVDILLVSTSMVPPCGTNPPSATTTHFGSEHVGTKQNEAQCQGRGRRVGALGLAPRDSTCCISDLPWVAPAGDLKRGRNLPLISSPTTPGSECRRLSTPRGPLGRGHDEQAATRLATTRVDLHGLLLTPRTSC
jgi:hypothetical protein